MAYLYETHLHTSQGSSCGVSRGRDYIRRYIDLGYTGIIVTDHFYGGNCAIDRSLPWERWVNQFCRGYEDAREEGERRGLDVFFGWEKTFQGDDYLVYGLDKKWLLKNPAVRNWTRKEQFEEVRRNGGCVVQAHPFRLFMYIRRVSLSTGCVDAVEAGNSANEQYMDAFAWAYAKKLHLPVTAGTDIHYVRDAIKGHVYGVLMDKKLKTIDDYVNAIRNNAIHRLSVPPDRFNLYGNERITLPVDFRDENDHSTGKSLWDFLS